jgi:hypothetical protein
MHTFKDYNFTRPTYCDGCQGLLWGLVRQGTVCKGKKGRFVSTYKLIQNTRLFTHLPSRLSRQGSAMYQHRVRRSRFRSSRRRRRDRKKFNKAKYTKRVTSSKVTSILARYAYHHKAETFCDV